LNTYFVSSWKKLLSTETLSIDVFDRKGPRGFIVIFFPGLALVVSIGSNNHRVEYVEAVELVIIAFSKVNVLISIIDQLKIPSRIAVASTTGC